MRIVFVSAALAACYEENGGDTGDTDTAPTSDPTPSSTTSPTTETNRTMSEDDFNQAYRDKYCDQLERCGADFTCTNTATTYTTSTGYLSECDYDPIAAFNCINGVWKCDDLNFPIPPPPCNNVFDCGGGYSTTGTSTTGTDTTGATGS